MHVAGEGDVALPIAEEGAGVVVAVGHVESERNRKTLDHLPHLISSIHSFRQALPRIILEFA